jgi:alkylation response protein AidB-like acyl-CoA dehydrogenase
MDFHLTPEEEAFRDEVRAFLDENLPPGTQTSDPRFLAEWNRKVREKRWVGFSWPKDVGGGGGTIMEQVILKEEMAKRKAPPLGICMMGLAWVGPAIIQYGTEAQKQRFIPDILDGKYQWCTGYSEPGSGSDLASLQCKGTREGDEYVVNGQKIWTSIAMWSKWIILLVRTGVPEQEGQAPGGAMRPPSKHDGITCLLVPMDSKGITVRPIRNMSGGAMFAEVFFDNVRVPVENRLGAEGQGWQVTVSALAHERSSIAEVTGLQRKLEELKDLAQRSRKNGRPALEDDGIRRRLARFEAKIEGMRGNGMRALTKQLRGEPLGAETSINKLLRAELEVAMGELALEMQGSAGHLEKEIDGGRWQRFALSWPEVVIGGGTPNIQKNIIAERVLGLPKD